jgi:hypothetical protein
MTHAEFKYLIGGDSHNPPEDSRTVLDRMPRKVKRHFLESELKTADDLIQEYVEYADDVQDGIEEVDSRTRQKLIWLLERLQEEIL